LAPDLSASGAVRHHGLVATVDRYVTVTEPTFVARLVLDPATDSDESVGKVDAFVDLPDGSVWALTIFTVDVVRQLLARWKQADEIANGSHFWAVDQLIVPEPGVAAMTPRRYENSFVRER
jgi:hypothetical protein